MSKNFYDSNYYGGQQKIKSEINPISSAKKEEVNFLKKLFLTKPGSVLLDLGCGTGEYLESLQNNQVELWGVEISHVAAGFAKTKLKNPEQIIMSCEEKLPFENGKFDYVTAWGVIEHFSDTGSIIQEITRVLKPRGEAFIMVPNAYYYKFVWDVLRKGAEPLKHQAIEFLYSFGMWKRILEENGLKVVRTERHNKFNKRGLRRWIKKAIPFYLSNHFIFFTEKI